MEIQSLTVLVNLATAIEQSSIKPIFLFKHSTRCPVSFSADSEYRSCAADHDNGTLFYHLDLIKHRDISDAMTKEFSIPHQSPQAILIRNGKAVWNASHSSITRESLGKALAEIES